MCEGSHGIGQTLCVCIRGVLGWDRHYAYVEGVSQDGTDIVHVYEGCHGAGQTLFVCIRGVTVWDRHYAYV